MFLGYNIPDSRFICTMNYIDRPHRYSVPTNLCSCTFAKPFCATVLCTTFAAVWWHIRIFLIAVVGLVGHPSATILRNTSLNFVNSLNINERPFHEHSWEIRSTEKRLAAPGK